MTRTNAAQEQARPEIHLSMVAPAYNEADNLPRLVEETVAALASLRQKWEILIVNDASTDNSLSVLRALKPRYPQLRVLSLQHRSGQTAALEAGLRQARGAFIAMLDADLQNDPADITRMLDVLHTQPYDLVNGWRSDRRDPWLRRISTHIANGTRNWLTHEQIHDSACGLKVFRRECLERLKLFNGLHRFLPTLVKMEGYRVIELPVNHRPRLAGKAKYGVLNRVFKGLRDCFAIRWMQRRALHYECQEWEP